MKNPTPLWSPVVCAVIALIVFVPAGYAQEDPAPQSQEQVAQPAIPADALDRGTPRRSLLGFLLSIEEADFERAAEYLDLRNLPRGLGPKDGPDLARKLAVVLARALWIDVDALSDDPAGMSGDGLPTYRDELGRLRAGDEEVILLLQHVPREDGQLIWKVSNKTVAKIPALYEQFGYGAIIEAVAKSLPDVSFLGAELFKWVITIAAGLIAFPVLLVMSWALARVLGNPESFLYERFRRFLAGPVLVLALVIVIRSVLTGLGLGVTAQQIIRAGTITTIVIVWMIIAAIDLWRDFYADRLRKRGREGGVVLLRPVGNAIKIIVVLVALLVWLDNIGFNITTLLAGLGVGGIAIALALQKPLEDLFGAITLYTQQPVKTGDFCRFGDRMGTVEEIGLRTARIRTLDNTVIAIPNARLASEALDNLSVRQKILYRPTLKLRYETSPDQLRFVLVEVRKLLYSHPKVISDGARIRFTGFGDHSLDLEVFAYIATKDYAEYLEVAEDLNLRIIDVVADSGTSFAISSQTLYVERGSGMDEDRVRQAEEQVQRWRENDELYMQNFPEPKIEELAGSIPYPAPGSARKPG